MKRTRKHGGREVLQKGKNGKRRKGWHHGGVEERKWESVIGHLDEVFRASAAQNDSTFK